MSEIKESRNWVIVTALGSVLAVLTLWLPWIFIPFEVRMKQESLPKLEYPEMRNLLIPFSTMETGLRGVVDVGILIPSWIFIVLIVCSGIISILTITRIFETSHWIVISIDAISITFLGYWVGNAISEGSKVQAGFPIALLATAMILLSAIKNHQRENKRMESDG